MQSILSTILLLASAGLLAVVGILYLKDRGDEEDPARPTSVPGHYQLIDIVDAIKDEGVDVSFGAQGTDVRSIVLERPGQMLSLDSGRAYVFIYPDIATQEDATLDVAAEDVDLEDIAGDPVDASNVQLYTGSNVAVLVVDSNEETSDKIESAITLLP